MSKELPKVGFWTDINLVTVDNILFKRVWPVEGGGPYINGPLDYEKWKKLNRAALAAPSKKGSDE